MHAVYDEAADPRPLCRFALRGTCRFGATCRDRHIAPAAVARMGPPEPEVAALQAQVQEGLGSQMHLCVGAAAAGAVTDGAAANCSPPLDYLQFGSLLLLGEGDFSFAAALAARAKRRRERDGNVPPSIVASSLLSEADVYAAHPERAELAVAELREKGATVVFEVDARSLDDVALPPAECVVWNMPFSGVEQAEPNQLLLRGFFAAVLRSAEAGFGQQPPEVHLTVATTASSPTGGCSVRPETRSLLSRACTSSTPGSSHAQYTPRRNDCDDTFEPNGQVLTYTFGLDKARLRAASQLLVGEPAQHGAFIGDCDGPQFSMGVRVGGQLRRSGGLRSEPANLSDPSWGS